MAVHRQRKCAGEDVARRQLDLPGPWGLNLLRALRDRLSNGLSFLIGAAQLHGQRISM